MVPGLLFGVTGFILQRIRMRRTTCEKCGREIRRGMEADSPISFHCKPCDIVWETGSIQDAG